MLELYENKHNNVQSRCEKLSALVNNNKLWWNQLDTLNDSIIQLQQFIHNIQHNFSQHTTAYKNIQSRQNRQTKITQMIEALLSYRHDRNAWDTMLNLNQFIK